MTKQERIAVALHDVEPATFEKCALIRDWLDDLGVPAVTLLVIPAADGHPFYQRSPQLEAWLRERRAAGDAIAQHGFRHARHGHSRGSAEFAGLRPGEAHERVLAGRRLMVLAGLEPSGFVAPGYVYTRGLRQALRNSFDWWATQMRCRTSDGYALVPAYGFDSSSRIRCAAASALLRTGAPAARALLRLDLHPADFEQPRRVLALERTIRAAGNRTAVTYDELLAA